MCEFAYCLINSFLKKKRVLIKKRINGCTFKYQIVVHIDNHCEYFWARDLYLILDATVTWMINLESLSCSRSVGELMQIAHYVFERSQKLNHLVVFILVCSQRQYSILRSNLSFISHRPFQNIADLNISFFLFSLLCKDELSFLWLTFVRSHRPLCIFIDAHVSFLF